MSWSAQATQLETWLLYFGVNDCLKVWGRQEAFTDKAVQERIIDKAAAGSSQLQELLPAPVNVAFRPLSHGHRYTEAAACPCVLHESKLLPRGKKMKRQHSVLYLYKCGEWQTELALLWFKWRDGFSEREMPFNPYGLLLRIGPWQRWHLRSPPPNSPSSFCSAVVNKKVLHRGPPPFVAV